MHFAAPLLVVTGCHMPFPSCALLLVCVILCVMCVFVCVFFLPYSSHLLPYSVEGELLSMKVEEKKRHDKEGKRKTKRKSMVWCFFYCYHTTYYTSLLPGSGGMEACVMLWQFSYIIIVCVYCGRLGWLWQ